MEVYMKFAGIKMVCRLLVVALMLLQFPMVQAGMIGADQMVSASAQADRNAVVSVLSRSEVASQLQSMGVDATLVQDRVAALTNDEVHALAGNLNSLPAGAMATGWIWLIVIAVGFAIYSKYNWK
jgi:hypothetical protein